MQLLEYNPEIEVRGEWAKVGGTVYQLLIVGNNIELIRSPYKDFPVVYVDFSRFKF